MNESRPGAPCATQYTNQIGTRFRYERGKRKAEWHLRDLDPDDGELINRDIWDFLDRWRQYDHSVVL